MALRREDDYIRRGLTALGYDAPEPLAPTAPEPAAPRVDPTEAQRQRALARRGFIERNLDFGLAGARSGLVSARGLARNILGPEGSGNEDLMRAVEIQEQAAAEGPRIQRIEDIEGVGDALEYAAGTVIQQIPNIASMIGTGGLTGLGARAATGYARRRALRGLGEEMAERRAHLAARQEALAAARTEARRRKKKMPTQLPDVPAPTDIPRDVLQRSMRSVNRLAGPARPASETATRVGAAAGGVTLQAGQMAEAALDDTQGGTAQERSLKAAAGALATGAVESMPIMGLLRRFGLAPAEQAAKNVFSGDIVTRMAKAAGVQAGSEGMTELVQTAGELATHKWINDNVDMLDDDALSAYINAVVGGAIGGAAFGAPAGLRSANRESLQVRERLGRGWEKVQEALRPRRPGPDAPADAETDTSYISQAREIGGAATKGAKSIYDGFKEGLKEGWEANSVFAAATQPYNDDMDVGAFADAARAKRYVSEFGMSRPEALFASTIPSNAQVLVLRNQGAFEAARKAFGGWDVTKFSKEEKQALNAYLDALPEDARPRFEAVLAKWEALAQDGVLERDADGSLSAEYLTQADPNAPGVYTGQRPPDEIAAEAQRTGLSVQQVMERGSDRARRASDAFDDEEAAGETGLSDDRGDELTFGERMGMEEVELDRQSAEQRAAAGRKGVVRAARGGNVSPGQMPKDRLVMRNGKRRQKVNFAQALQAAREADPELAASVDGITGAEKTVAQIAFVEGFLREQGWEIERNSIRAMKLGENWTLTPHQAAMLRNQLAPPSEQARFDRSPLARAARGDRAISPAELEEQREGNRPRRAVDDALGQADRGDVDPPPGRVARGGRLELPQKSSAERRDQVSGEPASAEDLQSAGPVGGQFIERAPALPGQGSPSTSQRLNRPAPRVPSSEGFQGVERIPNSNDEVAADVAAQMGVRIDPEGGYIALDGRELRPSETQAIDDAIDEAIAQYGPATYRRPSEGRISEGSDARRRIQRAERAQASDTDTRTIDSGETDRELAALERASAAQGGPQTLPPTRLQEQERARATRPQRTTPPEPTAQTGTSEHDRRQRKIKPSQRNRTGAQERTAARNTARATTSANERQQQIQDDAERAGSTERMREASQQQQRELGQAVGEAIATTFRSDTGAALEAAVASTREAQSVGTVELHLARIKKSGDAAKVVSKINSRAVLEGMLDVAVESDDRLSRETMTAVGARLRDIERGIELAVTTEARSPDERRVIERVPVAAATAQFERLRGKKNAHEALSSVLGDFRDDQRVVAERLLATHAEVLQSTAFDSDGALAKSSVPYGEVTTGFYISRASRIEVAFKVSKWSDYDEEFGGVLSPAYILLHEAVHAATFAREQTDAAFARDVEALYVHAVRAARAKGVDIDAVYGLSDTQEFLAEALSNGEFRALLQKLTVPRGQRNVLQQLLRTIANALGIGRPQQLKNLLDAVEVRVYARPTAAAPLTFTNASAASATTFRSDMGGDVVAEALRNAPGSVVTAPANAMEADSPWLMADGTIINTRGDHISVFEEEHTYEQYMRRTGAIRAAFFNDVDAGPTAMLHMAPGQRITAAQVATLEAIRDEAGGGRLNTMRGVVAGHKNPKYSPVTLAALRSESSRSDTGNVASLDARRSQKLQERARELLAALTPEEFDALMNDRMSPPRGRDRSILPAAYKETFYEWLRESERGESAMAPESQVETETAFLEEVADGEWEVEPHLRAGAANILANGSMTGPLTFTNASAASALRRFLDRAKEGYRQARDGAAAARDARRTPLGGLDFLGAVAKLMESKAGAERIVQELPRVRSRVSLYALTHALRPFKGTAAYDRVNTAVYKRLGQLNEQISAAGHRQATRARLGQDAERVIPVAQYRLQHDQLVAATDDARGVDPDKPFDRFDDPPPPAQLTDVLQRLRRHMNPQQQRIVDAVLKSGAVEGVQFWAEKTGGGFTGGYFHPALDRVVIQFADPDAADSLAGFTNDMFGVLVHETVHAATMFAELKNARARKDLNALMNHVRDELEARGIDPDDWYGLSDTQEFLAEAFSNPLFQEILESTPALNTTTFRNAWEQFKGWVRELLGFTSEQATALDEILAVGRLMMEQQGDIRAKAKGGLWASGPGGVFNSAHNQNPADLLKYLSPEDRARLIEAFDTPQVKARIRQYVPKNRQHLIDAADTSAEMLLNWGVGLTLDGKLKIGKRDRSAVGRLWDVISKFLQIPSANVYAQQILKDLRKGAVKANYKADEKVLGPRARAVTRWVNRRIVPVADALLKNMNTRLRESGVPAMREMATLLAQRTGEFRSDRRNSLRQNWTQERDRFMNQLHRIIGNIDEKTNERLVRALQERKRPRGDVGKLYDSVRAYLDEMYDYMTEAGVELGRRRDYFPVVMDREALAANRDEFFALHREFESQIRERFERWTQDKIDALPKNPKDMTKAEAKELRRLRNIFDGIRKRDIDELIGELYDMAQFGARTHYMPGVDFTNPGHKPAFKHANHMTSDFIFEHGSLEQKRRFAKFQSKNLAGVLAGYTNRSTRRAEWERLNLTDEIDRLMAKARDEGADAKQLEMMRDYVNMEMGTYNDDWNPVVKRLMVGIDRMFDTKLADTDFQKAKGVIGALQTYNNVRLLPLALLSSLVDPIAISIRSGTPRGAFKNLREGLRAYRNKEGNDALRAMAEQMGIIEREGLSDLTAALYGNIYDPDSRTAKVNSWVFRLNGMEAMLRFTRLSALAAGHRFLIKHKTQPNEHSERYLKELGLTPSMIRVTKNGRFVVMSPQIETALRRFVDESTVRPTPGQKPSWHNDPNFSLAAQYKGYLYAFYETVLKRIGLELGQGNPAVMAPMLAYVPITMMAEMTRDLLQDDGDEKEAEDYLSQSIDRSGLLGPRLGVLDETAKNVKYGSGVTGTLGGATGQQIGDAYSVLSGSGSFGAFFEEALPGQALYKNWGDE